MRKKGSYFGILFMLAGVLLLGADETVEAKKYYSLQNIGLSGCAEDDIDYSILSIRGNTVRYVKYEFSEDDYEWVAVGKIQKARLTPQTKYYMGNLSKLLKRIQKGDTVDGAKWMSRVRKGMVKKEVLGRYNEIRVKNGRVVKIAIRLNY